MSVRDKDRREGEKEKERGRERERRTVKTKNINRFVLSKSGRVQTVIIFFLRKFPNHDYDQASHLGT